MRDRCRLLPLTMFAFGLTFAAGCATVPMAPDALDVEAKQFSPGPDRARIYVIRSGQFYGSATLRAVLEDGRLAGFLAPKTYLLLSVTPGEHTISTDARVNPEHHTVLAEAGHCYFFRLSLAMGWTTVYYRLRPMSALDGRAEVLRSKRAVPVVN